ncbi:hypothetical protein HDU92_007107 [Lobulomyces angularis]|nr:hypothetical protein HDU92_007107 [Lobulomyces angularis]
MLSDESSTLNAVPTLSDFELIKTIGTGTFGRVYLTKSKSNDLYYAMKVLKKSEIIRLKQLEHITSEKNILTSINFPFIVNLLCTFKNDYYLFMLEEYVVGGEIFSHLRRAKKFSNDVTKFYVAEITLAIEYLHSLDIIYRDLKPENLLLDSGGHVKITDFGFAKKVEDRTWTLCGTPEYLAPEIIKGTGHGKPVDWWAVGILTHEMLAGYPPFYDDSPKEIYVRCLRKILGGSVKFPSYFDSSAADFIKKLLQVDLSFRLGNLKNGSADVKNHSWFKGVNWNLLLNKKIVAPFIPKLKHPGDTSNFDQYNELTEEEAKAGSSGDTYCDLFLDF